MPKYRLKRHSVTQPLDESYRLIALTRGQNAIVDTKDFEWLSQWNWCAKWYPKEKTFYAVRKDYKGKIRKMHRILLGEPQGKEVDHRDHNTLNNQRGNLRPCTHGQNVCNSKNRRDNTSGFRGVWFDKRRNNWTAETRYRGKHIFVGSFLSPAEAAKARDELAKKLHGEFAVLNFPEHTSPTKTT